MCFKTPNVLKCDAAVLLYTRSLLHCQHQATKGNGCMLHIKAFKTHPAPCDTKPCVQHRHC